MKKDSIGVDIVEFVEIEERLNEKFVSRVLSVAERQLYDKIGNAKRKTSFLAGRFAAKEAYAKAYKTFSSPLNFRDVSVLNDADGAPYVVSKYRPEDDVMISISHSRRYAIAMCIVRNKE